MFAVTIDLDQYDNLPPRQLKTMLRALRFADEGGVVHASLTMLAMPGLSRSTAHRELTALTDVGYVDRQARPEGGFLWRIGRRFRHVSKPIRRDVPSWNHKSGRPAVGTPSDQGYLVPPADSRGSASILADDGTPVPAAETPVPQCGTTDSRAPALVTLSSELRSSERELEGSPSADEIPKGWEEAAAAERRLAGLGPVNLRAEWRKLVAYSEGQRITIWRWRGWVLKARCDRTAADLPAIEERLPMGNSLPGDERQQRQARDWVRRGFWLRSGAWGPAPDQAGCELPPDLVAWCLREQQKRAA